MLDGMLLTAPGFDNIPMHDVHLLNSGFVHLPRGQLDCGSWKACFCPYGAHEGNHPCPDCCNNPIAQLIRCGLLGWRTANRYCQQRRATDLVRIYGLDPDEVFSDAWEWHPAKLSQPYRTVLGVLD